MKTKALKIKATPLSKGLLWGLLSSSVFLGACSKGEFSLNHLSPDQKEEYASQRLLTKSLLQSRAMTTTDPVVVTPGGNSGSEGGGTIDPIAPPEPICPEPVPIERKVQYMLYQDKNLDGKYVALGILSPFEGLDTAVVNYGYRKASAHPIHGPKPEAQKSKFFLYKDSSGIHLTFFSNVEGDLDPKSSPNNRILFNIATKGNQMRDRVILSDDKLELRELPVAIPAVGNQNRIGLLPILTKKNYIAQMEYWKNTDGGVIGPFGRSMSGDQEIHIDLLKLGDIKNVEFVSSSQGAIGIANKGQSLRFKLVRDETTNWIQSTSSRDSSDDVVVSPCVEPPLQEISMKLNPVESVTLLTYPSPCVGGERMFCNELMPLNDFLVKGVSDSSKDITAGLNVELKFSELYAKCAAEAKLAKEQKKSLLVTGRGESVKKDAKTLQLNLSDIKGCSIDKPVSTN